MPVPETSSYSRRYGREDSTAYSSYSRSTSTSALGAGRSSYLSYSSKGTSTLPPRPPSTYELRKYTDSNIGSRFLSNSASRVGGGRDYGSSSNYRSSVSPVRASASSIRRQLETSAPSIAERIKAMELGESEQEANAPTPTRVSRLSSIRSRDKPISSYSTTPTYSRDRSGSRDYGQSSLLSGSPLSRGDSTKSSLENLRNRERDRTTPFSTTGSTSGGLSRSGSGGGSGLRNGTSSRFGSIEVNSENDTSSSTSNGVVLAANTTIIPTKPKTGSVDEDFIDVDYDKCVKKDVENNDSSDSGIVVGGSSASSSLSATATSSPDKDKADNQLTNGFSSVNNEDCSDKDRDLHGSSINIVPVLASTSSSSSPVVSVVGDSSSGGGGSSAASGVKMSGVSDGCGSGGDENGNPIISIATLPPSGTEKGVELGVKGSGIITRTRGSRKGTVSPAGAKDKDISATPSSSRFLKKYESDNNANNIHETPTICNGEATPSESSSFDAVLNYSPKTGSTGSRKLTKSPPKVIYHTIQVEEDSRNTSVSPEPVYTLTARPSLDGTAPKIELKNVTKKVKKASSPGVPSSSFTKSSPASSETVSAEFKVKLPKLKSANASSTSSPPEQVHNNKNATNSGEEDVEESGPSKLITVIDVDSMNDKSGGIGRKSEQKEISPAPQSTPVRGTTPSSSLKKESKESSPAIKSSPSPTPEKQAKSRSTSITKRSLSKSREGTPASSSVKGNTTPKEKSKSKSPSPTPVTPSPPSPPPLPPSEKGYSYSSSSERKSNGEVHVDNINSPSEAMGPHVSKPYTNGISGTNKNEPRYGRTYGHTDSSDNESDTLNSSPHSSGSGRFRPKDGGYDKAGLTGLRNIGNTCFMNTVLQCLSNTRPLLEYVMGNYESDINRTTSGMKGALMRAFGSLIKELWQDQRVVDTSAFKDSIQRFAPRFMGYSQQDAQEFLRYLLEGMHEDVNRVTVKPTPITTDIEESWSDNDKAVESWRRYMRYESSKIVDMFVGQFKSTLKCTVCGHCSVTFDPFWDLSLPIPSRSSSVRLSQCFELLTKEEVLDGDEKPTCSNCKCRRKCTKSLAIQKFPKILVVHLKRFSLAERYRGKLSTLVDFPLNGLDLTQFAAVRGNVGAYNLYGVANHSGSTYSGHYIAYCKHPYSNEWHCYNDSRVSPMSPHSVVSSEGYVLFYEQVGQSSLL